MKDDLMTISIQKYLARFDDEELLQSEISAEKSSIAKLNSILGNSDQSDAASADYIKAIRQYMEANPMQKNKLLSYCEDFCDSSIKKPARVASNTLCSLAGQPSIVTLPHKSLNDSELDKLYQFVKNHEKDKTFGEAVYEIMAKHDMTPPQVYKQARLSRQDYNRIMSFSCTSVTKTMVWSMILGLNCNLDEADYLMFSAGYRRRNNKFDLILTYFVQHRNYDIMAVNEVLASQDLKLLSCYVPVVDSVD